MSRVMRRLYSVNWLVLGVCYGVVASGRASQPTGGLVVVVDDVRNDEGSVHVDICTEKNFLRTCLYSGEAKAVSGKTAVIVEGVPKGVYAAQVFHDENMNHKVDRGLFGIPKEGVGFSNDFKIGLRAPRFDEAAFHYAGGDQQVVVHLKYYLAQKAR